MRTIVPDYYKEFHCIADKCKHTCCKGWEIEIDEESRVRFEAIPDIYKQMEYGEDVHFRLPEDEVCPFLQANGLCRMILTYGDDMLCQTCRDHPRFRNYWEDRVEMGLGLVCEEAARLVLSRETPMKLEEMKMTPEELKMNPEAMILPEDEAWLMEIRDRMLAKVPEQLGNGPIARLKEYLIYRHIPNALYDDRLEERIRFVEEQTEAIEKKWMDAGGNPEKMEGLDKLIEIVRVFSYDVEYDEEVMEEMLDSYL